MKDDSDPRQRVLGDYQQLKANGMAFYGTFTANGIGFGRPFANTDAIFFKASADPAITSVAAEHARTGAADEVVTINGAGFASGAHVTFSNPGIHVLFMPSIAASTITVEVTISPSASARPVERHGHERERRTGDLFAMPCGKAIAASRPPSTT